MFLYDSSGTSTTEGKTMGEIAEPGEKEREIIIIPEKPQRTAPNPSHEPEKVPEREPVRPEKEPAKTGSP